MSRQFDLDTADHDRDWIGRMPDVDMQAALWALTPLPANYVVDTDDCDDDRPILVGEVVLDLLAGHTCPGTIVDVLHDKGMLRPGGVVA